MTAPLRRLGSTDLKIAPLVLGGNVFGWTANKATSFAVLDAFADGGGVMINDAKVVKTDVVCKNGVIHWVDTVLLP